MMNLKRTYQKINLENPSFNYIEMDTLAQYITEQGKILPKRVTGLTAKKQKEITRQIKRARILSLIPFVSK